MESPIDTFLRWFDSEKENEYISTVSFLFLCIFPGYGIKKVSESSHNDRIEHFKEYLLSFQDPKEILGLSLSLHNIISFNIRDWDNVDDALEKARMFEPKGDETESELSMLKEFRARHFKGIEPRKSLKESWDSFKDEQFNYEVFHQYSISSDFSKGTAQ